MKFYKISAISCQIFEDVAGRSPETLNSDIQVSNVTPVNLGFFEKSIDVLQSTLDQCIVRKFMENLRKLVMNGLTFHENPVEIPCFHQFSFGEDFPGFPHKTAGNQVVLGQIWQDFGPAFVWQNQVV